MRRYLTSLSSEQFAALRRVAASAVGNDWSDINRQEWIDRYVAYCQAYRITKVDLMASFRFLRNSVA